MRFLAALFLLLGAVAPAAPGLRLIALQGDAGDSIYLYESRDGDTLDGIARDWLVASVDGRALQRLNAIPPARALPQGTEIRIERAWLRDVPIAAEIAAARGPVYLRRGVRRIAAAPGQKLAEGDGLETGPGGFVTITLADESRVSLPSQSRIDIVRLRERLIDHALDRQFLLGSGESDMKVTPMTNRDSGFLVSTPIAVAAVRGTAYRVRFSPPDMRMMTEVDKGVVGVRLLGARQEIAVRAGFVLATRPGAPGTPRPMLASPVVDNADAAQKGRLVSFHVRSVAGASRYRIELASDSAFVDRVAMAEGGAGMLSFAGIAAGGFYGRAYAEDAAGNLSAPRLFRFARLLADSARPATSGAFLSATPDRGAMAGAAGMAGMAGVQSVWDSYFPGAGASGSNVPGGAPDNGAQAAVSAVVPTSVPVGAPIGAGNPAFQDHPFVPRIASSVYPGFGPTGSGGPGGSGVPAGPGGFVDPIFGGAGTGTPGTNVPAAGGPNGPAEIPVPSPIPEPRIWLLLIFGFGMVGFAARGRLRPA